MRQVLIGFLCLLLFSEVHATTCTGRIMNPLTDVCWTCIFPISIGPVQVTMGHLDAGDPAPLICTCPIPAPPFVRFGIGVGFWEPARVAEVVRSPYCSPSFGGINLAGILAPPGAHDVNPDEGSSSAFYHAHWLYYPLLSMMDVFKDALCTGSDITSIDMLYMTELDPLWMDDELSFLLNPEAALFASQPAQAACVPDCLSASVGFPLDPLFWCAGCNGSLYPISGASTGHIGGLQTSLLMVQRMAAKLHRQFIAMDSSSIYSICMDVPAPILPKRQYKTQVIYPIPQPFIAHPLGRTSSVWGTGQEFPVAGENWAHLIWRKNLCCSF